jgi:photosystem II stability/assembly factor-like uncharacterized protein
VRETALALAILLGGPWRASADNAGAPVAVPFQCDVQQLDAAGAECTGSQPCRVFLELTAMEVVGAKIFVIGNLHTGSTTLASIVLASADEGATWKEPAERMPLSALEGIQFIDFERGWIAGETVQPVPRDPFFLITGDGGRTWKKQFIFQDEDHPGSVESFDYDSPANGTLVIDSGAPGDRHELYRTSSGGSEWKLERRSATPMASAGARLKDSNTDWRIRADGRAGTYNVEKHGADGWQAVARFTIEAAVCTGP